MLVLAEQRLMNAATQNPFVIAMEAAIGRCAARGLGPVASDPAALGRYAAIEAEWRAAGGRLSR